MSTFHRGDIVRLKGTNSPIMVVRGLIRNRTKFPKGNKVVCVWHDKQGQPQTETYPEELLEVASVQPVHPPSWNNVA